MPEATNDRVYGPQYKLIGKNYVTADLLAKVTGRSKYAEDFRAEGMLFCKLLLSPLPHARVRHIDARDALAMLGVKAILTADDLPAPADTLTDNGTVVKASKWGERGHHGAGVSRRTGSRRGGGGRTDRRRSHRNNPHRL